MNDKNKEFAESLSKRTAPLTSVEKTKALRKLKIDNMGLRINVIEAYQQYKSKLPWWRRIFWPWLSLTEKQRAVMSATLKTGSERQLRSHNT